MQYLTIRTAMSDFTKAREAVVELKTRAAEEFASLCSKTVVLDQGFEDLEKNKEALGVFSSCSDSMDKNIHVNVGGKVIKVSRLAMSMYPDEHYFVSLICGKYDQLLVKDKDGRIFVDFDVRWVDHIINFCRDLAMWNGEVASKPHEVKIEDKRFENELVAFEKYFCPEKRLPTQDSMKQDLKRDSGILSKLSGMHYASLFEQFPRPPAFSTLLYRGSRDLFLASSFHDKCDGKPNTLTIIRGTDGNVFAGYASVPWQSMGDEQADPEAFLLTIANKGLVGIKKHKMQNHHKSYVYHSASTLCVFGSNKCWDLLVENGCSQNYKSYGLKGLMFGTMESYIQHFKYESIPGHFQVQEIEVYRLVLGGNNNVSADITTDVTDDVSPESGSKRRFSDFDDAAAELLKQKRQLQKETQDILTELRFIARYTGVTDALTIDITNGSTHTDDIDTATCIAQIASIKNALQNATAPVMETVTISAGGTLITTTKDTLRQAPEGSPLANMASDVWGHDLDSDGNIYQDVNSELFVAIINHLRLKQLLGGTSIQVPPIVVYKEQKTALDNLLAFYMLTGLPVDTVSRRA